MVVKRPKLTLAERLYLPAIATGLAITLKHLKRLVSGKTHATMEYPEQRWDAHPVVYWLSVLLAVRHREPAAERLGGLGRGPGRVQPGEVDVVGPDAADLDDRARPTGAPPRRARARCLDLVEAEGAARASCGGGPWQRSTRRPRHRPRAALSLVQFAYCWLRHHQPSRQRGKPIFGYLWDRVITMAAIGFIGYRLGTSFVHGWPVGLKPKPFCHV